MGRPSVIVGVGVSDGEWGGKVMDRVEMLEERVAHLMRAVEDLSDVVAAQTSEVGRLTRLVGLLAEREAEREAAGDSAPANVRPPHW